MGRQRQALIVRAAGADINGLVDHLRSGGFSVCLARDFQEGRAQFLAHMPDLLITDLRLGAYNGLHLVVVGIGRGHRFAAVVLAEPGDERLRHETEAMGAVFAITRGAPGEVEQALELALCEHQSPPAATWSRA